MRSRMRIAARCFRINLKVSVRAYRVQILSFMPISAAFSFEGTRAASGEGSLAPAPSSMVLGRKDRSVPGSCTDGEIQGIETVQSTARRVTSPGTWPRPPW
ncbi:hypothetical protein NDU88_001873 [Pleurodeles waltl]|uniref:Secreted protein n=1 Tax=Pleurodeles waltl TaxID=8319 RepID=A0AAV7NC33_PLEWA|nr:hypothetical protein NDU88_001873 [Pleurodeles waltl]